MVTLARKPLGRDTAWVGRGRGALAVVLLLSVTACADDTLLRVVVDADPTVRARSRDLHLAVESVREQQTTRYEETRPTSEIGWPAEVSIVPRTEGEGARVRVELTALAPNGTIVSRGELETELEIGTTREIHVLLTTACVERACGPQDGGTPSRGGDAGASMDGGMSRADGGGSSRLDAGAARPIDAAVACPSATEVCDGVRDDDCDARIDEGCECADGAHRACEGEERGACSAGTQRCSGGRWGACEGRVTAQSESCNRSDDDCDGATDEDLERPCGDEDRCVQTCRNGEWGRCEHDGERCDRRGRDDDD